MSGSLYPAIARLQFDDCIGALCGAMGLVIARAIGHGRQLVVARQRRDFHRMLYQWWASVYDAGPPLIQHWVKVSSLPGGRLQTDQPLWTVINEYRSGCNYHACPRGAPGVATLKHRLQIAPDITWRDCSDPLPLHLF